MKQLTHKLVLPLTIISFAAFTKWWFVLPVDAPSTMMTGFPLIFLSPGWHTSISLQIFLLELTVDLLVYFLFWYLIVFCVNRMFKRIKIHKLLAWILNVLTVLIIVGTLIVASNSNNIFYLHRDFEIQVLEQGFKSSWRNVERPDIHDYVLVQPRSKSNMSVDWDNLSKEYTISYVQCSSNPFLGGNYLATRVDKINFIDTIKYLDSSTTKNLFEFLKDSDNMEMGAEVSFPFVVNSGFIFTQDDTLIGTINLTYDYKYWEFEPAYKNATSWMLTDLGLKRITRILNEIENIKK